MRWPWQRRETRDDAGSYTDLISRLVEARADGTAVDSGSTAALEAASGALSRAFMAATVEAPPDIAEAVSPRCLGQIGRDLIRVGESLHVIRFTGGRLRLVPCSTWYLEGGDDPDGWTVTATAHGPSGITTWRVPWSSVVFVAWGAPTARPYHGLGPAAWASTTARLQGATERALADEAAGPVAQVISVPSDDGDGEDDGALATLRADIAAARGRAVLVETTSGGWGEGRTAAPTRDWQPMRLGPTPTDTMATIRKDAFEAMLAACGTPPSLFLDADGTSQREALRRWHSNVVIPLSRMLEHELTEKLGAPIRLKHDSYPLDMVSRSQVVAKLTASGVALPVALEAVGLVDDARGT